MNGGLLVDWIVKAMAQVAVQGGETAEAGRIQAVLHELLREFGQRAEFVEDTRAHGTRALSAFLRAQVEMLDTTALLHSHPRHPKAQRTAFGRLITAPAQHTGPAGTHTGYPSEQTQQPCAPHQTPAATARGAASIVKTLGWITASSVAEVKATEQAAAFGRVAAHFNPATHYQGATIHPLPSGCGPPRLLRGRQHSSRRPRAPEGTNCVDAIATAQKDATRATSALQAKDDAIRAAATFKLRARGAQSAQALL